MADYEHDIFLSYSTAGTVVSWLDNHFLSVFEEECIDEWGNSHFRVFHWSEQETGTRWPLQIQAAHAKSKLMLSVLTPSYFLQSYWCNAEWDTMLRRETHCNLNRNQSLIVPLLYSDGNSLPESAKSIVFDDFRKYAAPDVGFRLTSDFTEFRRKVRSLLTKLDARMNIVPPFQDWPTIDLNDVKLGQRTQKLPRVQ
jgi:hypothetical protein